VTTRTTGTGRNQRAASLPGRRRWLPLALVGVGVAVIAAVALVSTSWSGRKPAAADVTDPARFDLPALIGDGRVRLADFKGKPVVVNFFASWCGPCEAELPEFAKAARALKGKVSFVAVNSQELRAANGVEMARSKGLDDAGVVLARDVGPAPSKLLHDALGRGMPLNAFYDSDGRLLEVRLGALVENKLAVQLERFYGVTF
jgi:cytochrome c biogenesis protein CcmG, thiol:disulfide interchange protein DsbE